MRILAFDHFFDQDLAALRSALRPGERLDVLPYQRLHRVARRHFPTRAFRGLDAAGYPSDAHWTTYLAAAEQMADWWAGAYRPDVFAVPTDAIFYLRPVIERLAGIGIPTVVVQKETSISPMVMELHSAEVRRTVPFLSSAMTVCSERNRAFWVRAGTPPEAIIVTGQPRFDVYADPATTRTAHAIPPRLLYLSYDDIAYLPSDIGKAFLGTWRQLRRETEQAIARAAATGRWRVTVKRHPQQAPADHWVGPQVDLAPQDADTRHLILSSDVVVAFQTTAVYEAVVAGKPVLYPAWGPVFEAAWPVLLPLHDRPGVVTHLRGPADLAAALARSPGDFTRASAQGRATAEEHLGAVDGKAAERVMEVLRRRAGSGPTGWARPRPRRIVRAAALAGAAPGLRAAGAVAGRMGRPMEHSAAHRRADHWMQEAQEAWALTRRR